MIEDVCDMREYGGERIEGFLALMHAVAVKSCSEVEVRLEGQSTGDVRHVQPSLRSEVTMLDSSYFPSIALIVHCSLLFVAPECLILLFLSLELRLSNGV